MQLRYVPALLALLLIQLNCAHNQQANLPVEPRFDHPKVRVHGVDGTIFHGELLNGSLTIDSGQGQLTLLTQHMNQIDFSPEADTIDSTSVKVAGKIREPLFMLKSEHGVFTLLKERLKKIEFTDSPGPTPAIAETNNAQRATPRPRTTATAP